MSRPAAHRHVAARAIAMLSRPKLSHRLLTHAFAAPRRQATSRLAEMLGRSECPNRQDLAALRPATRIVLIGLLAWIAVTGLMAMTAIAAVELSTLNPPDWFGTRVAAPRNDRSVASYDTILQRPVFSRARQRLIAPMPVAAPVEMPAALDRSLALKGVFISDNLAKAFVTSAQNPQGLWVQVNDEVSGWRVVLVQADQLVLESGTERLLVHPSINGGAR